MLNVANRLYPFNIETKSTIKTQEQGGKYVQI